MGTGALSIATEEVYLAPALPSRYHLVHRPDTIMGEIRACDHFGRNARGVDEGVVEEEGEEARRSAPEAATAPTRWVATCHHIAPINRFRNS